MYYMCLLQIYVQINADDCMIFLQLISAYVTLYYLSNDKISVQSFIFLYLLKWNF